MDIHSGHIWFAITLYHTQKLPTVSFVEARMVCNQINRGNSFELHICHDHTEQMTCNSFATIVLFRIDCADIWRKVFSVVKVILYDTHTAYNLVIIQAKSRYALVGTPHLL